MKDLCYWKYGPPSSDDEWVGRTIKNAFGIDETVVMQVSHWKLLDWLSDQGSNMQQWIVDADMARHHAKYTLSLSQEIIRSLVHAEKKLFFEGKECPLFINPDGYKKPSESKESGTSATRELTDAKGEKVSVTLLDNYWRLFDWLGRHEMDMDHWVKEKDVTRDKGNMILSLQSEIMLCLRDEERQRFLDGRPCPLCISPNGYAL